MLDISSKNFTLFNSLRRQLWIKRKILQEKYRLVSTSHSWRWPTQKLDASLKKCLNTKWEKRNKLYQTMIKCLNTKDRDTTDLHKVWAHHFKLVTLYIRAQVPKHCHRFNQVIASVCCLRFVSLLQPTKNWAFNNNLSLEFTTTKTTTEESDSPTQQPQF